MFHVEYFYKIHVLDKFLKVIFKILNYTEMNMSNMHWINKYIVGPIDYNFLENVDRLFHLYLKWPK